MKAYDNIARSTASDVVRELRWIGDLDTLRETDAGGYSCVNVLEMVGFPGRYEMRKISVADVCVVRLKSSTLVRWRQNALR